MAVALITGASSGIGRHTALELASRGHAVAVLARRAELLDSLVAEIESAGGRALALPCDVTDRAAVLAAVKQAEASLGPVEVLIGNAGGGAPTHVDEFQAEQIEATIRLNTVGVAHCIEAVLPGMLERGAGHLVAVSSLAGSRGLPSGAAYSSAKAALDAMMESLRIDLRPRGIHVTIVAPGPVRLKPKSKKSRLISVSVDEAARRIADAVERRPRRIAFPATVALPVALARLLPASVYDAALAGRGKKKKKPKS
ncbi:MAG: SDR family NAD(P)-dependent oxidoreductase [Myxococcota bacterium]|nr:SDR family NAD(P)-dependent oxidoreductase [Myxococcota bacterium]